tara:strand:+ start:389 stop:790 length:402 start_codon:yes stop_codon:yes gene_type:complete
MREYLSQGNKEVQREYDFLPPVLREGREELPVSVENSQWTVDQDPERLKRVFTFESIPTRNWFISEVLEHEKQTGHYGSVNIDGLKVTVEVHTHDISRVTELDQEYAEHCDQIYQDVNYITAIPKRVKINVRR